MKNSHDSLKIGSNVNLDVSLELISAEILRDAKVVPVEDDGIFVTVLCSNEDDLLLKGRLEAVSGRHIRLKQASEEKIAQHLSNYEENRDALKQIGDEFKLEIVIENDEGEYYRPLGVENGEEAPIVKLINSLIQTALKKRVSDIHVECNERFVSLKYRIDGVLYPAMEEVDISYHAHLITRFKVMSELDIAEKKVPQDGRFRLRIGKQNVDFRVSVIPGFFGENIVIRILESKGSKPQDKKTLKNIGFSETQYSAFNKAINEPHGLVLVTGPTGSGKTTTLYTALESIHDGSQKIITIEDPVEYNLDGIMQIPVNNKKGLTFAKGLRSILRHDPDKIFVGEIRDAETADIAIQSALTGHLVMSTLHANSALDVLSRLQNMGANIQNCLSALNCILCQRLIRIICENCKREYSPNSPSEDIALEYGCERLYEGQGCEECNHTGFSGRAMIGEIFDIDMDMKKQFLGKTVFTDVMDESNLVDKLTLRDSAIQILINGKTSLKEINRVTFVR